ncbi:MAG: hypothetical protein AMXMBFR13_43450 [Phycisphaerae bacterium]
MADSCEMPMWNASPDEIRQILSEARSIAVVGLSDKPDRDSHRVARYMQEQGYHIIPVNPTITSALGERARASLRDVKDRVDIVDIFRRPEAIPGIVDDAISIGARVIWMQSGLAHNAAASRARAAGLQVVMNHCIMVEHRRVMEGA